MISVIFFTIGGFVLSIFSTYAHFSTTHGILGLIVFIGMFLQPFFGILVLIPMKNYIKWIVKQVNIIYSNQVSSLDW